MVDFGIVVESFLGIRFPVTDGASAIFQGLGFRFYVFKMRFLKQDSGFTTFDFDISPGFTTEKGSCFVLGFKTSNFHFSG